MARMAPRLPPWVAPAWGAGLWRPHGQRSGWAWVERPAARWLGAGRLLEPPALNALAVFRKLGEAEAKSHDVPIEKVHFHEVGAVDSICDILGACVALDSLQVDEVYASRINVGSGTVNTEHGVLPVPAPATAELLREIPIYAAGPETELTTPTGAALLATLSHGFGAPPPMTVRAQGFGAGDKEFPMQANLLRVLIGDRTNASESTTVSVLEANIDDSTLKFWALRWSGCSKQGLWM